MSESSICPYCDKPMDNPRRVQCGDPECFRQWNNERQKVHGKAWRDKQRAEGKKREKWRGYEGDCPTCGVHFKTHKPDQAYCSPECWQASRRQKLLPILHPNQAPYTRLPANHPVVLMQRQKPPRLYVMGWCARCKESFVIVDQAEARYCSTECAKKEHRHTRRLRKYGSGREPYRNEDIYERDGWRCHLCGRKVKKTDDYTHPLSPTVVVAGLMLLVT